MRVIAGSARGCKLASLAGDEVRPTTDRVKEAMFSILQFQLPGSNVLDLFAGSGQLGIEALSRGAAGCVFVDHSPKSRQVQLRNLQSTGFISRAELVLADSIAFLLQAKRSFDIVLLDPPYHSPLLGKALEKLAPALSPSGIAVCEHSTIESPPADINGLRLKKRYRYGKIQLSTYCLNKGD